MLFNHVTTSVISTHRLLFLSFGLQLASAAQLSHFFTFGLHIASCWYLFLAGLHSLVDLDGVFLPN